jgi:hypothetical protein
MAIAPPRGKTLEELTFSNSYAALGERFVEHREPEGIPGARLVAFSPAAAELIELRPGEELRPEFAALCAGNALVRGMDPVAARYGGHQFGVWAGQLGDGRAILLGEVRNQRGEPWELQIKGAGMHRVLALRRRTRGRALDGARVSGQRSDGRARDPDHARARDGRRRRTGHAREHRACGDAHPHGADVRALRLVRDLSLPRRDRCGPHAGRLRHRPLLPRCRRRAGRRTLRRVLAHGRRTHGRADGGVAKPSGSRTA